MTPQTITNAELIERIRAILTDLERVKPLYAELDQITLELVSRGFVSLTLPDGSEARLTDNFESKNVAFRVAHVRRYEIEFTSREELDKACKKRDKAANAAKGA